MESPSRRKIGSSGSCSVCSASSNFCLAFASTDIVRVSSRPSFVLLLSFISPLGAAGAEGLAGYEPREDACYSRKDSEHDLNMSYVNIAKPGHGDDRNKPNGGTAEDQRKSPDDQHPYLIEGLMRGAILLCKFRLCLGGGLLQSLLDDLLLFSVTAGFHRSFDSSLLGLHRSGAHGMADEFFCISVANSALHRPL